LENLGVMLWKINFLIDIEKLGSRILVHGHTPISLDKIRVQKSNCLNIDGGCVFKNSKKNLGHLVALNLDSLEFHYTECID